MDDKIIVEEQVATVPCPVCGEPNPADSKFCFTCGRQLDAPTMNEADMNPEPLFLPEVPKKPKKNVVGIVITAIIAALLLGACGYLVFDDITLRNQLKTANATIETQEKNISTKDAQITQLQDQSVKDQKAIEDLNTAVAEKDAAVAEKDAAIAELEIPAGYIDQILQNTVTGKNEKTFYVDDNIVVLKKGETAKLTLYTDWENGGITNINYTTDAAKIVFDSEFYEGDTTTLTVTTNRVGATLATFTNTVDSSTFQVLVIVTE